MKRLHLPAHYPRPFCFDPELFRLLDRQTETANVIQALHSQEPVECVGEPGSGKTSLLRHLAYNPQLSTFSSGVVYFQVNQLSMADPAALAIRCLLRLRFSYQTKRHRDAALFATVNALVLLDDVEINSEQIKSLMNVAPNCTFLTATTARSLLGEAREVEIADCPLPKQ